MGILNGNNYRIINLTINKKGVDNIGLFGVTNGAQISSVSFVNANIIGNENVGTLVGQAQNKTIITQIKAQGTS